MIKRYSFKKIEHIFSDLNRYSTWLQVEEAHLDFLSHRGIVSHADIESLKSQFFIYTKGIKEEEKLVNHDVVGFVNFLIKNTYGPHRKWIHYGLTSSNIVDTANSLMIQKSNDIFSCLVKGLLKRLKKIAFRYKYVYIPKFENGIMDGIDSFGMKVAWYYSELEEALESFYSSRKYVECVSMGGSMGLSSHINSEINEFVATRLGLYINTAATQVLSRDRYFKHFSSINRIIQTISKMATEFRELSRTEIGGVSEMFFRGQVGSSSMPHKRNPINLESICGLSRIFSGYVSQTSKNIQLWFERDLTHSSADRIIFQDAFSLACQIVKRMSNSMNDFHVDEQRFEQFIKDHSYSIYESAVKRFLLENVNNFEGEVDLFLKTFKEKMNEHNLTFEEALLSSNLTETLTKSSLLTPFKPSTHLPFLDQSFRKIFSKDEHRHSFSTIYYEKHDIDYAIDMIAQKLNFLYKNNENLVQIIAFREGSIVFLSHLLPKLKFRLDLTTVNTAKFKVDKLNGVKYSDLDLDWKKFKSQDVLIIDDLVDRAITMHYFKDELDKYKPRTVRSVVLFASKDIINQSFVDYFGLILPTTKYVAGFGMDVNGNYRNCSFVGRVKEDCISI